MNRHFGTPQDAPDEAMVVVNTDGQYYTGATVHGEVVCVVPRNENNAAFHSALRRLALRRAAERRARGPLPTLPTAGAGSVNDGVTPQSLV